LFNSHHPVAHKRAVVKSLTDRAKAIPSSVDQQSKEMKHVIAALRTNGYHASKPKRPSQQTPATVHAIETFGADPESYDG